MPEPLVKVMWKDAHGIAGTTALAIHEIPHGAIEITSFGLLLKQDEHGVSIASEICADGTYRGYTFVPSGMLISVDLLSTNRRTARRTKKIVQTSSLDMQLPSPV